MNIGTVVQVVGPVVDVEFPDALPPIYNALTVGYAVDEPTGHPDPRSPAASRRQVGANHLDVRHRGPQARPRRSLTAADRSRCRLGTPSWAGCSTSRDSRWTSAGPVSGRQALSDPSTATPARGSVNFAAVAHDRHQGHRLDLPVPQGWQGWRVRRRWRRQDCRDHGAHQQHRQAARRRVGLRRRRRTDPRRQRPLSRDVSGWRHQPAGPRIVQDRAGLRPDERTARCAAARRTQRPRHH